MQRRAVGVASRPALQRLFFDVFARAGTAIKQSPVDQNLRLGLIKIEMLRLHPHQAFILKPEPSEILMDCRNIIGTGAALINILDAQQNLTR